ncbi:MAG TPA: DUF1573 domain-containing protein [Isosphaeraceae bacterium]|jgi:hypothetical protein|nr:DUF1573 domain-containing protein [Isosphaeraceae bacterium]
MLSLLFVVAMGQVPAEPGSKTADLRCGSYSLYIALKAIDRAPPTFEDLEKTLGSPGPGGYSMKQLEDGAKQRGAQTIAVETTLDNLRWRREPFACITLINDNHFVVFYNIDDQYVYYINAPHEVKLPIDTFRPVWSRQCLLIGPEPFAPEESIRRPWSRAWILGGVLGIAFVVIFIALWFAARRSRAVARASLALPLLVLPLVGCSPTAATPTAAKPPALRFVPDDLQLGSILRSKPNATIDASAEIHNDGGQDLVIDTIVTSCSCSSASIDRPRIAPGTKAVLTARIALGDLIGEPRRTTLTLSSNDPHRPRADVVIQWSVLSPLRVEPAAVSFSTLAPGQGSDGRQFDVLGKQFALCDRCELRVEPDSPLISAEYQADPSMLREDHGAGRRADTRLGALRVRLLGSLDSRSYDQTVLLSVTCGGEERDRILIPVRWNVGSAIEPSPSRLALGPCRPGELFHKTVLLRSAKTPFRVLSVTCEEGASLAGVRHSKDARRIQAVNIDLRTPERPGPWRSMLHITTDCDEARELVIPVSALMSPSDVASS